MRAFRFLSLAILAALVASSAAVYAQDEKPQEDKPKQEEPKPKEEPKQQDQTRPETRQDEMKTPAQEPSKQEKQEQKQEQKQEDRSHEMKPSQQESAPQARPGRKSAHIPDDKFRAQFGRSHTFVVSRPVMVENSPGFFYGGYSFVLVDAWPAGWDYNDDCYVDYIDGEYFLFDLRHPGVRIALIVVM